MKKKFEDIFESINLLHKKYSSQNYLDNLEKFNNSSGDLQQILEKYNTDDKGKNKTKRKIKI